MKNLLIASLLVTFLTVLASFSTGSGLHTFQFFMNKNSSSSDPTVKVFAKPINATEPNMQATMQVAFSPLFESLKQEIGSESKESDVDFENVSRDSLLVSELLARLHQWPDISDFKNDEARANYAKAQLEYAIQETQADAVAIYKSAKSENFKDARKHFIGMTNNCNICHEKRKASWVPVVLKP